MKKSLYTVEEVKNIFNEQGFILLETEYKNIKSKLNIIDKNGYKYFTSLDAFLISIKNNQKPYRFSTRNPFSTENVVKWIKENTEYEYVSGIFYNAVFKSIKLKCPKCKNVWDTSWNYIQTKRGCNSAFCKSYISKEVGINKNLSKTNNLKLSFPEIALEWDYSKNVNNPETYCPKSDFRAFWICSKCSYSYKSQIKNRCNGHSCPICKSSKGEKEIKKFLEKAGIEFVTQKRFSNCKNIKQLPFDFYLSKFNICIEYNGKQHYESNAFFGGEKGFEYRKNNDNIKRNIV